MEPDQFRLRGSHPLWPAFPCRLTIDQVFLLHELMHIAPDGTYNTPRTTVCTLAYAWVWALPRSLAATWGISI